MMTPPPIPTGFLTRWCTTLSEGSESPPGAFLPTGLAALSAIVGPRLVMRWTVTHEERLNLWILNVGMSALARKTSGLSGLHTAISWCREDNDDLVQMLNLARISDAGLVTNLDVVGPDTAKAVAFEKTITPKGEEPREIQEVVRPVPKSWVVIFNEVSPIWMEDGPGWAMDAQRAMLAIYDGRLSSTTKQTQVPHQDCFVTAIGNIPPGVFRDQTTLGMLKSGFVGRWLTIATPPPERVVAFPMPNGADPLARLRQDVDHLMALAKTGTRNVVNHLWTPEAIAVREEWYRRAFHTYRNVDTDDTFGVAQSELWGRLQATAIKVATLIAVSRQIDQLEQLADLHVDPQDVEWGCTVIDQSIQYVIENLADADADAVTTMGKTEGRILRYLERAGATTETTSRTFRVIADDNKGGRISRNDVLRALDGLIQMGHVHAAEDGPRTKRAWLPPGEPATAGNAGTRERGKGNTH